MRPICPENDLEYYFSAALLLRAAGEVTMYNSIIKKIEKMFKNTPEKNGIKIIGKLTYYPSGIVTGSNRYTDIMDGEIVISSWIPASRDKTKPLKKQGTYFLYNMLHLEKDFKKILSSNYKRLVFCDDSTINDLEKMKKWICNSKIYGYNCRFEIYQLVQGLFFYKKIKNDQNSLHLLNSFVTKDNYKAIILFVVSRLLNVLRWRKGKIGLCYFSRDIIKKIESEVSLKEDLFSKQEVFETIITKIKDDTFALERFDLSELKQIYDTFHKIVKSVSFPSEERYDKHSKSFFRLNTASCISIHDLNEYDETSFDEMVDLLEIVYRKLCQKTEEDLFIKHFCYVNSIVSEKYLIYPQKK